MKITNVTFRQLFEPARNNLAALVSIVIDDSIAIHGLKIIDHNGKLFVSFPSVVQGGARLDIVHPINSSTRQLVESAVMEVYQHEIKLLLQRRQAEAARIQAKKDDIYETKKAIAETRKVIGDSKGGTGVKSSQPAEKSEPTEDTRSAEKTEPDTGTTEI